MEASARPGQPLASDREALVSRLPREAEDLAAVVSASGGRLLIVGGFVRDALIGRDSKDLDFEIYGLTPERAGALLEVRGFTPPVGKLFPVWRHTRLGFDVSFPRTSVADRAPEQNSFHRSDDRAEVVPAEARSFEFAARGRDLTLNAIAWDISREEWIDPLGGRSDLRRGLLRAADVSRFAEDPLRALRVARMAASLDGQLDDELLSLCTAQDLSAVPIERVAGELRRMLMLTDRPWRAFEWLDRMDQLAVFPRVAALKGVPQDPKWHPEGDVFIHTGLVVNAAAELAAPLSADDREVLMWAALCHDLGKAEVTERAPKGRIRSPGHDVASARIAKEWLESLRISGRLVTRVEALCRHHLAPALFVKEGAGPKAYRRLARKLADAGLKMMDLERFARADQLGRTTDEALSRRFDAGDEFLEAARLASVDRGVAPDVVRAADWMRAGVPAGPELGRLLARCREVQDDTGWIKADQIMAWVRKEQT